MLALITVISLDSNALAPRDPTNQPPRGIPNGVTSSVVARGRTSSLPEGQKLYAQPITNRAGEKWTVNVMTRQGKVVSTWLEPDSSAAGPRSATAKLDPKLDSVLPHGGHYYLITEGKVAYSVRFAPLVIADFAADGSVRGIEFLGRWDHDLQTYLTMAQAASLGPCT
jgi:hypothetical protein